MVDGQADGQQVRRPTDGPHRIPDALFPSGTPQLLRGLESALSAVSYLVSGVLVWGAVGYGLDHLLGTGPVFALVGAVLGNAAGVYLIYLRWPVGEEDRRAA